MKYAHQIYIKVHQDNEYIDTFVFNFLNFI